MKIILVFFGLIASLTVFAGESRIVATCKPTAQVGAANGPSIFIFNAGTARSPRFEILATFRKLAPVLHSSVDNYTIHGEEVHFDAPGFRMEVITNLDAWSDGVLPGTDTAHPENAFAIVWTSLGGRTFDAVHFNCLFNK